MLSKLVRHGHSSAVIIPAHFLKNLSIKRGDRVNLKFDYHRGQVILTFLEARQLRLAVASPIRRRRGLGAKKKPSSSK